MKNKSVQINSCDIAKLNSSKISGMMLHIVNVLLM